MNLRESYKHYQKHTEDYVSIKVYLQITLGFIQFLMRKICDGKDIKLPSELGILGVRGKKVKPRLDEQGNIVGLAPDWVGTKVLWDQNSEAKNQRQLLYHFNEHSAGFRYKVVWFKKGFKFKNKSVYSIKLSRANKRAISDLIKQGKEYTEGRQSREKTQGKITLQNEK